MLFMSNPVLNDRVLNNWAPPVSDGPISAWPAPPTSRMTVGGSVSATAVLLVLLLASATVGWLMTGSPDVAADGTIAYGVPGAAMVGVIVGFGLAILLMFKPHLARILAPIYALAEGIFVGAISRMFETFYDGIVIQAAGATVAVVAAMLVLYATGIVRVTDRFRRIVMAATMGVMVFYGISFIISLFGGSVSFLSSSSGLSIGFSLVVAGLAAFNLALDFDFIEKGAAQGLPKHFEWFAGFGILVTVVWLYLEILRLLAKMRER
jgi:uncharacterized YccA/Bax inhibitor family protein